uniref:Uncharacterized protein n=1 Tax=Aegilops tauschii subsp. strangulata TaxID=200361 RepID=A0A453LYR1_AEGTS
GQRSVGPGQFKRGHPPTPSATSQDDAIPCVLVLLLLVHLGRLYSVPTWSRGKLEERGTGMASEMLLRRIHSICRLAGGDRRPQLFGRGEGLRRLVSPASHPSFCSSACEQAGAGSASKVRPSLLYPQISPRNGWMQGLFLQLGSWAKQWMLMDPFLRQINMIFFFTYNG